MYGLRDNYNNEDTIYSWSEKENIYETIHDMGGNDTIDLSTATGIWKLILILVLFQKSA